MSFKTSSSELNKRSSLILCKYPPRSRGDGRGGTGRVSSDMALSRQSGFISIPLWVFLFKILIFQKFLLQSLEVIFICDQKCGCLDYCSYPYPVTCFYPGKTAEYRSNGLQKVKVMWMCWTNIKRPITY